MKATLVGRRLRTTHSFSTLETGLFVARDRIREHQFHEALDIYEHLAGAFKEQSVEVLAEAFDSYEQMPGKDRYTLYQARHFDFGIVPGDKVLDIGSGHHPLPLATHLADFAISDHAYGRAGVPFKYVSGKPVFQCSVESMGFNDKEFDFAYCSHVLEHVEDPEQACRELMRVAKRGYLETPTRGKDLFLNTGRVSNHRWSVEWLNDVLVFTEYKPEDLDGLESDILLNMHCGPQTKREKAFAALIYLKADKVNTMVLWDTHFQFEVRRRNRAISLPPSGERASTIATATPCTENPVPAIELLRPAGTATLVTSSELLSNRSPFQRPRRFLQIHTFYSHYLQQLYAKVPGLAEAEFQQQIGALERDGFSAVHLFPEQMRQLGYEAQLIVANCQPAQLQWLRENSSTLAKTDDWMMEIVRQQIESIQPDVLYLTDPVTFDSRFVRSLRLRPSLVLGWRAANIPEGTDWSEFDVILSGLSALRDMAVRLGAKSAEAFYPGFPEWIVGSTADVRPLYDVVFSGQCTTTQHARRNFYLRTVARASREKNNEFSCGFYLTGHDSAITTDLARCNLGGRYGLAMYQALRSGRIALDARGSIGLVKNGQQAMNLAGGETINMRLFEATGSGVFLLTEHHDNLCEYFEPGKEVETFRDARELVEKIRYYLSHSDERKAIARAGQERCLRAHSAQERAKAMRRIIESRLGHREEIAQPMVEIAGSVSQLVNIPAVGVRPDQKVSPAEPVLALMSRAASLLSESKTAEAFNLLIQAKRTRTPIQGLDCLRAICFMKMGQVSGSVEALREELRHFPNNVDAQQLLSEISAGSPQPGQLVDADPEFSQIYRMVRHYTMLSEARLYSLFCHAKEICVQNWPGNFVECGVAAGGSSALLACVIKKHSRRPRRLFSFDSFEGMPAPTAEDRHQGQPAEATGWGTGTCSAPESSVRRICAELGVWDVVTPIRGYFQDTLPRMRDKIGMIALLHLDGDWYESTRAILNNFYDRVLNDGFLQVDDYGHWEGCRKAIQEFMELRGVEVSPQRIDTTGVWFRKPDRFLANPFFTTSLVDEFDQLDPVKQGIESQMSANERFQLFYSLRKLITGRSSMVRFVEIGSYAGGSLSLIANTLKGLGVPVQGFAVEPGGTQQFYQVLQNLNSTVHHLKVTSNAAASHLKRLFDLDGHLPQFIMVDGDHSYEGVRNDIIEYFPLLAPGGLMAFHDFLPPLDEANREAILSHHGGQEPGIRQACLELMEGTCGCRSVSIPLLYPSDPSQTQAHLPIIPGVFSTIRVYRKPAAGLQRQ